MRCWSPGSFPGCKALLTAARPIPAERENLETESPREQIPAGDLFKMSAWTGLDCFTFRCKQIAFASS